MRLQVPSLVRIVGPWSCIVIFAGCGGADVPETLVPVTGNVTNGGKPMAGVLVSFNPQGETQGTGGEGVTDENGQFTLQHRSGSQGVEPGKYEVAFMQLRGPDGSPLKPSDYSKEEMESMAEKGLGPMPLGTGSATITEGSEQQLTFDLAELRKKQQTRDMPPHRAPHRMAR